MDKSEYIGESRPQFFDDPWQYYNTMLEDIAAAKKCIYIETYKFGSGNIGERFNNVLTKKAKEGVEVKLLIDSWGAQVSHSFFRELEKNEWKRTNRKNETGG